MVDLHAPREGGESGVNGMCSLFGVKGRLMNICRAIKERKTVEFHYDGLHRKVIPVAHGMHAKSGNSVLRAYQIDGFSSSRTLPVWSLFRVDKISSMIILEEEFDHNPPGYVPGDSDIFLCCELGTGI
jgi:hypothetical protein